MLIRRSAGAASKCNGVGSEKRNWRGTANNSLSSGPEVFAWTDGSNWQHRVQKKVKEIIHISVESRRSSSFPFGT